MLAAHRSQVLGKRIVTGLMEAISNTLVTINPTLK